MATRRSTGKGTIYARKDENGKALKDSWVAQISVDGKRRTFTGRTRKEASARLEEFKRQAGITEPATDVLFGDFITDWVGNVKQRTLKPTSYDRLESTVRNQILPYIADCKLADLTYDIIQREVINRAQDAGKSYSTIKKAYNVLNECVKYAIFPRELITRNPMTGVTMPSKELFESKDIRYFSDDEIARFKAAALATWSNGQPIYPLGLGMVLMLNTGVRIGEALAWRWSDYDADAGLLHASGNLVRVRDRNGGENSWTAVRQTPKTAKGRRSIPVNASAKAALEELKKRRYFGGDTPILAQEDGTYNTVDNYSRTFEAIVKRAGIKPCGIHTLRHTFATQIIAKGTDVKVVSALLGHASVEITYNVYVHVLEEQTKKAVNTLCDI